MQCRTAPVSTAGQLWLSASPTPYATWLRRLQSPAPRSADTEPSAEELLERALNTLAGLHETVLQAIQWGEEHVEAANVALPRLRALSRELTQPSTSDDDVPAQSSTSDDDAAPPASQPSVSGDVVPPASQPNASGNAASQPKPHGSGEDVPTPREALSKLRLLRRWMLTAHPCPPERKEEVQRHAAHEPVHVAAHTAEAWRRSRQLKHECAKHTWEETVHDASIDIL